MGALFVQAVSVLLLATGCVVSKVADQPAEMATRPAQQAAATTGLLALQDCFNAELRQPFGSGCDALDAASCRSTDWDVLRAPVKDYACFGLSEHLSQCGNCNILNIPDWTPCKNQQYMDCLLRGHIPDHGPLCFVTSPEEIPYLPPDIIRVTARESCYYYHQTRVWKPQQCPAAASCCKCTGGTDNHGNPMSAWCNDDDVCGADLQYYDCVQGRWVATGAPCGRGAAPRPRHGGTR